MDYNPGYKQPGHTAEIHVIRRWKLAEGMRFELTVDFTTYAGLANRCLQPLGHPSARGQTHTHRLLWSFYAKRWAGSNLLLGIQHLNLRPVS